MRLVDIQRRAVALRQLHQRRQIGAVAVHAEYRLGHDQLAARGLAEQLIEMIEIVVAENLRRGAGQPASLHDAGVIELVAENRRTAGALRSFGNCCQCRNHRGVGLETGGEQQRCLAALEVGQPLFDR